MKFNKLISLSVIALLLTACDKNTDKQNNNEASLQDNKGALLAEVDGEKIHQQQLDALLVSMFGEYQASLLDEQGRKKALDSMVASKALVKVALQQLGKEEIEQIEFKSQQYRENILVNAYVKQQMTPQPVSNVMIEEYYQTHLENFGQKKLPEYELLTTKAVLADVSRDKFLQAFSEVDKAKGLKYIKQQMEKKKFSVEYHKGVLGESVLQAKIHNFIKSQKLQKVSNITFIDNKPYIALIISEQTRAAAPLSEVRENIRKTLAMKQVKETVKKLSEEAVKQVNVVYQ